MAKPPTPETIAATLTPRERLALLEIRDGKHFNWEGGGEDAAKLNKKRLIRRKADGSLKLSPRGRAILGALFQAESRAPFAIGVKGEAGTAIVDVKGPASNRSDMGHTVLGMPQSNSTHSPPVPQWFVSQRAAGGVFGFAESVPASPPYADAFERAANEAILNPDPAVEREIFDSAFKAETNEAGSGRHPQAEPEALPITLVNDKGKPIAGMASNPNIQGGIYGPIRENKKKAQTEARRPSRKAVPKNETIIKIRSRSQVIQYSRILIAALEEVVGYDPVRHHNQPPPDLRIEDEDYLTEIRNLITELRTLNALLEATRRKPKKASETVVNLTRHLDTFLNSYAKSVAKGAGWLTIATIGALLYQAGIGQDVITNILSHAKLPPH